MSAVMTAKKTKVAQRGSVDSARNLILVARVLDTPLGAMVAAGDDEGLWLLEFCGDDNADGLSVLEAVGSRASKSVGRLRDAARRERGLRVGFVGGSHPVLDAVDRELSEYARGERREFSVPVVLIGSAFQERVWRALLAIPYGQTLTYGGLAAAVGYADAGHAARAVGQANGSNRIAVVVPCHRVIAAGGGVGGYAGGLERKHRLLGIEGVVLASDTAIGSRAEIGASGLFADAT